LYCDETGTLQEVDQKYIESFEMWCWIRVDKISWNDHVKIEEALYRDKEKWSVLHTVKRQRSNCTG
jgi:hypothetical protein